MPLRTRRPATRATPQRPIRQPRPNGGPFIFGEFTPHNSNLQLGSLKHDPAACLDSVHLVQARPSPEADSAAGEGLQNAGKAAARKGKSDLSLVRPSAPRCCTSRQNPLPALRQVRLILFEEWRNLERAAQMANHASTRTPLRPPHRGSHARRRGADTCLIALRGMQWP
jgi:hypothetical protein